ncbi:MAG: hypothetical protein GVY20_05465 [Bacteroidetes bacterium]|jgi:hypothetical protein|nr:hypothetical protein [Bacteroidota bacterium]
MKKLYSNFFLSFLIFSVILFSTIPPITFAQSEDDEPSLHVGGALRFNMILQNYESDIDATNSAFTMDTWRINVLYDNPGGIGLNFEYRFYPTFGTHFIKQGWLEYNFTESTQGQLGVTQVPFGNVQYNSHNWWFSLPYYVGLEDDHDMGLKITHNTDTFQWDFAYFFQAEPEGPPAAFGTGGPGRYSYDIIPGANSTLTERNQFNLRSAYKFGASELGASIQYGQLYNSVRDEFDNQYAFSLHADINTGNFNILPQILFYGMDAQNDVGEDLSTIFMGAYAIPYEVSTDAWIATLGISYSYDVEWGPVTNLNFYNDFSYMSNTVGKGSSRTAGGDHLILDNDFQETLQNITGVLVTAGPVYTYFDIAQGINHPWLTHNFGVGVGPGHEDLGIGDSEYNIRFNINVGFYF